MTTENMCKKRQYATEAEAVAFSESWAIKHPNSVRQHPYRCEDCIGCYHLTTQTSESYGLARPRQITPPKLGNTREDVAHRRSMVLQQRNQGLTARAISAALGISLDVVYSDFTALNGAKTKPPITVDSLVQQKKAIEAQIEALRLQEAAMIEAKRLKLVPCFHNEGVLITKEGEKMGLRIDDAFELVDRLTEYLTALPATVPSRQ
jgi:hypothetical protein